MPAIVRTGVEHAKDTVLRYRTWWAGDGLHVVVMARHDITELTSIRFAVAT